MDGRRRYDAVIVGGGPGGSTCARFLVDAGLRVAIVDAAEFPRVKLCAGWLSEPVWDALAIAPSEYPHGLWRWNRCHVRFDGASHTVDVRGYFIRRVQFDDYLLHRSGADLFDGHRVSSIARDGDDWIVDDAFAAPYLIGAGGTHCPVARALFPTKTESPVGVQELEFPCPADDVAATRVGDDGEPELLLHDDLRGYSWNVPKTDWLNVGAGTFSPRDVRRAWRETVAFFRGSGHLPDGAIDALDAARGHSYYLFDAHRLADAHRDGAFLVGDALGLAHPLTAEGILPAIVSGRACAEAIAAGAPASYPARLREHPLFCDYSLLRRVRDLRGALPDRVRAPRLRLPGSKAMARPARRAIATGFAWMFAGKSIPAGRAVERALRRWRT